MYTFVCAQQFRRDEYHWHSKNIHDDILGGMNNWVEQRCPLASYGCGFSMRRMYPKLCPDGILTDHSSQGPNSTIVFSSLVESFGISALPPKPIGKKKTTQKIPVSKKPLSPKSICTISMADLPYEVVCHIIGFLDSFR